MHIIIDTTTTQDQFAFAGVGQYTKNITLSLLGNYPNTQFSILRFKNKISTLDKDICKYKNVQQVDIGEYQVNGYKNDITYYSQVLPVIKKIKRKDSIYLCPYFWRNFPSNILPTVLFVHDMNLPLFNMYSQQSPIHNLIRKFQYWKTLNKSKQCKFIICNSQTTKNDFLKYYPKYPENNVHVTYLGIDINEKQISTDRLLPHDYKQRGYFIYLGGGINRSKNSIGVIKGYRQFVFKLKQEGVDKKNAPYLVIAGGKFQDTSKPEVAELIKYIKENELQRNVAFTGFYEDKYAYSLLNNSLGFLHLALYEGFGISAAEALRSKTPTILHKNPVYEEIFKNVSVLVDGLNELEVGNAIYDIYKNRQKYQALVQKGYDLSLSFSWDKCAQQTFNIFEKVEI
ncbi:glycosyltransferase family 4 protein [Candidatus Dojkabacteria bacterium]|uniref:Glycosyltransferase family 4 protein n=1 Tax=Candidatus Dojkabacteria bacterium TaxID=2099670 RepID=A0A847D136_9BACT|nr:glycosyltransferase family 4 protein [Candidatus Dojkabacteria bacterium]